MVLLSTAAPAQAPEPTTGSDGVRLDHIAEMFRLEGGEIFGDMRPRSESRLAVLPNTTHVTLMQRASSIIPMVIDFLDAKLQKE